MSVAPTVFQYSAIGLCGMVGGISFVDCSAGFPGGAMDAGSDFIYGNGALTNGLLHKPILGAGVWSRGSLSESLSLFSSIVLKG